MKKRSVKFSNHNLSLNYLLLVNLFKLTEYVETYFGDLTEKHDKSINSSIEVLYDKNIGTIYKIEYVEPFDLDYIIKVNHIYIGQFGHLYKTKKGFNYSPITNIENLNWFKFMKTQLNKTNLIFYYDKDFEDAHKAALILHKQEELKAENKRHKEKVLNIEESFNDSFDLLDEKGIKFFIEQHNKEIENL